MVDPFAEVVALLQPIARFSKVVVGAGRWSVRRAERGQPFYAAILAGSTRLAVDGHDPVALAAGDFVLVPAPHDFTMSSREPPTTADANAAPVRRTDGAYRVGDRRGATDVRMLVGHCTFGSPDASLLVSLLPRVVHVRGEPRLGTLVDLLGDESRASRPARDVVLERLLEVLLIEALRSSAGTAASPGLARGLADPRLAGALRAIHAEPARAWTMAQLAKEAALSRSGFFARFSEAVGVAPMAYLLGWRMALAKDLLRRGAGRVAEVAERVGYGSASTFSVAFARHVGLPPARYARSLATPD